MKTYPVIEIFGPVIQGEGPYAGAKTHFIRFGGCDYRCSWCDTMYAVDPVLVKQNATRMSADDILASLKMLPGSTHTVTFSGGNPVMHDLTEVAELLFNNGYAIHIETQGSRPWAEWMDLATEVIVSPKPPSSGMQVDLDILEEYLRRATPKVVVFDKTDLQFAKKIYRMWRAVPHRGPGLFFIQPGTIITEPGPEAILQMTEWIWKDVQTDMEYGDNIRILPQIHSLVYGQQRGV